MRCDHRFKEDRATERQQHKRRDCVLIRNACPVCRKPFVEDPELGWIPACGCGDRYQKEAFSPELEQERERRCRIYQALRCQRRKLAAK